MTGVLRTALTPRWLALLALVLLAATGMSLLGQWQLDRARERGRQAQELRAARHREPVPLDRVLRARETFPASASDQRISAAGTWDSSRQLLVAGRPLGGRTGFWVLTPLVLDDGSAVPVVRGWVAGPADPAAAAPAHGARVRVTGVLQPSEPALDTAPGQGSGLPAGQIPRVAVVDLITRWPYPLLTGYVIMDGQDPPGISPQPQQVAVPLPPAGLAWRNLSYAVQWWLFAGFGLFLWWRAVRDDHRARTGAAAGPETDEPPGERPRADGAAEVGEDVHAARLSAEPAVRRGTPGAHP